MIFEIIVGIPFLIKAIILGIHNILEVLLEDLGILKMESIFLQPNITIIPHSILYVSVGIKIHYRLSTNSYIINILSYTVLR